MTFYACCVIINTLLQYPERIDFVLEKQPWMTLKNQIVLEWQQCEMEGLDVAAYKDISASADQLNEFGEKFVEELAALLHAAPLRADYPYDEPSDFETIRAVRPEERADIESAPEDAVLRDKLRGAWIGRIAGCLLGKPVEGWRSKELHSLLKEIGNFPMTRYIMRKEFPSDMQDRVPLNFDNCWADTLNGIAPVDDDTNYTVFALKLVETYGKDFRPNDVLEAWLSWIPMFSTCTAERVAYRNAALGLLAPETATYKNPYREWIGAQIRGDFFGYLYPGNPEKAAELAFRDASISHVKNGIYGEMMVAAMIAEAAVSNDMMKIIRAGLGEIPEKCRLRSDIENVISWYRDGLSEEEVFGKIHSAYDEYSGHGWCYTNSNAMIVVMALLWGKGDFGKSICLAVQTAFDTDCNGATVGSILGMMLGAGKIPACWSEPFACRLSTTISGYETVTVDVLTEKTLELIHR